MLRDDISNEKIIAALDKHYGIISSAALELRINRRTLTKYIDEDEVLGEAAKEARFGLKDLVESQLVKNVKRGKEASIIFAAKTLVKDRGYVERHEYVEHKEQPLFNEDDDDDPTEFEEGEQTYNNGE